MLTDRERYLLKLAVVASLHSMHKVIDRATNQMLAYRKQSPESGSYYLTHRHVEEIFTQLDHWIEDSLCYDDVLDTLDTRADLDKLVNYFD